MSISVVIRGRAGDDRRLTFDGAQRIVIGRGPGSDVRLPDATVSHRHARLESQAGELHLVDEGSTNGAFVGGVRVAAHSSRIVRSGDTMRFGRVEVAVRVDGEPATRDLAMATRDLALAMVSEAMAVAGTDPFPRARVVEGQDQGAMLVLSGEGRAYLLGRAAGCDLVLTDPDVSREHVRLTRQGGAVTLQGAAGAKNGTWLGDEPVPLERGIAWRPGRVLRLGRSVVALEDPLRDALAAVEGLPDEPWRAEPREGSRPPQPQAAAAPAPPDRPARSPARSDRRITVADGVVAAVALAVLLLSLAGLYWVLRH